MGLAGIIAIGCITFAAIQFQLSQGDTEKIKKARELMTSCIMGLILIIFSVFILRVIGVDILQLPGLGK
jgi:putative Mn2+ efflux pump MntP